MQPAYIWTSSSFSQIFFVQSEIFYTEVTELLLVDVRKLLFLVESYVAQLKSGVYYRYFSLCSQVISSQLMDMINPVNNTIWVSCEPYNATFCSA